MINFKKISENIPRALQFVVKEMQWVYNPAYHIIEDGSGNPISHFELLEYFDQKGLIANIQQYKRGAWQFQIVNIAGQVIFSNPEFWNDCLDRSTTSEMAIKCCFSMFNQQISEFEKSNQITKSNESRESVIQKIIKHSPTLCPNKFEKIFTIVGNDGVEWFKPAMEVADIFDLKSCLTIVSRKN